MLWEATMALLALMLLLWAAAIWASYGEEEAPSGTGKGKSDLQHRKAS